MSAGFTPGPWRAALEEHHPRPGERRLELCTVPHSTFDALDVFALGDGEPTFREHIANTNLLAAGPEMFEALRLFVEVYDAGDDAEGVAMMLAYDNALTAAKAALAKARGNAK